MDLHFNVDWDFTVNLDFHVDLDINVNLDLNVHLDLDVDLDFDVAWDFNVEWNFNVDWVFVDRKQLSAVKFGSGNHRFGHERRRPPNSDQQFFMCWGREVTCAALWDGAKSSLHSLNGTRLRTSGIISSQFKQSTH